MSVFIVILLAIMLIGFFILGMIGIGEGLPMVLAPFLLFFIISIYVAKAERAQQTELLKKMDEKLQKTENELAKIKALLKQEDETEAVSEETFESGEKSENSEKNKE